MPTAGYGEGEATNEKIRSYKPSDSIVQHGLLKGGYHKEDALPLLCNKFPGGDLSRIMGAYHDTCELQGKSEKELKQEKRTRVTD